MTDDDVVKSVLAQHYGYWDVDEEGKRLEYETQRDTFWRMASTVTMKVEFFQDWKKHLTDALTTVKNWRVE